MPGIKRQASASDDEFAISKLPRRAASRGLLPRHVEDEDWTKIGDITCYLDLRYNPYVPFAQNAGSRTEVWRAGRAVQRRVDRMQRIWDEARNAMVEEEQQLYAETDAFIAANESRKGWWMEGNVLTLPHEDLVNIQSRGYAIEANALHAYLQSLLPEEQQRLQVCENVATEIHKFWAFAEDLYRLPRHGQPLALDVTVSYITDVLRRLGANDDVHFTDLGLVVRLDTRVVSDGGPDGSLRSFLNIAAAGRRLRAAYLEQDAADRKVCDAGASHTSPWCFHTAAKPGLRMLQKAAYGEVRAKVMLTIGTLLPAELAELVVEYAMIAEGLPATNHAVASVAAPDSCPVPAKGPSDSLPAPSRRLGGPYMLPGCI